MKNLEAAQKEMRGRWAPRRKVIQRINGNRFRIGFLELCRGCGMTPEEAERWLLRAQMGPIIHDVLKSRSTLRLIRGEFLSLGIKLPQQLKSGGGSSLTARAERTQSPPLR